MVRVVFGLFFVVVALAQPILAQTNHNPDTEDRSKHEERCEYRGPAWFSGFYCFFALHDKFWVAFGTLVLAVGTGVLGFATVFLWRATRDLVSDAKTAGAEQLKVSMKSAEAAQDSAKAAMKAAETAERALFLDQRPWLHWTMPKVIEAKKAGRHITAQLDVVFENTGKTPAPNALFNVKLYTAGRSQPVVNVGWDHLKKLSEGYRTNQFSITTILPGEKRTLKTVGMIEINELLAADGDGSFQLYLAFHAGYRIFDGGSIAEVASLYQLQAVMPNVLVKEDPSGDTLVEVAFTMDIFEKNKVIPVIPMELPVSRRIT